MVQRRTVGKTVFDIINYTVLAAIGIACILPMWHVLAASFSQPAKLLAARGTILWPLGNATAEGYRLVFNNTNIATGYGNTLIYVACFTVIGLIGTLIAGYILSRPYFMFKNIIVFIITFTMMFNGGMVPTFIVIRDLHMYDTRWAIILPGAISVFNIIIMRTSIQGIPNSLEESAKLDGAGNMTILFRIFVPLLKATIAVIILYLAVGMWNSWFQAMLYLRNTSLYPLQLILREILIRNDTSKIMQDGGMQNRQDIDQYQRLVQYCTTIVATLPILCIYPFVQRFFVTGVMIGSLKG